jgi:hypothetical protein
MHMHINQTKYHGRVLPPNIVRVERPIFGHNAGEGRLSGQIITAPDIIMQRVPKRPCASVLKSTPTFHSEETHEVLQSAIF